MCNKRISALLASMLLGLVGCAGIQPPHRGHLEADDSAIRECAHWFATLDTAVSRARVGDIDARRVTGFPYLRIDRFAESFAEQARADARLHAAWIEHMRALDADGRRVEIANLPTARLAELAAAGRDELLTRSEDCAAHLARVDFPGNAPNAELARRAWVADDYSPAMRALGLYELTRIPFHAGVSAWQERATQTFVDARRGAAPQQPLTRYLPPNTATYKRREVGEILARAARHPLGIAQLSATQRARLFATYAPVFEIETGGDYDRIGKLYWSAAGPPRVDTARPTVYRRLEYTRVGGRSLLQLVYIAWLPERPREHAFDLLAGHLDGIVWRVTLAPDGEPVLYDSIHPCGCYHMFFPTPRVQAIAAPRRQEEWAFIPAGLPRIEQSERLIVGLQTRSHYLRNVWPGAAGAGIQYRFADYDELRALPLPDGGSRSIFRPDGLIAGSERGERFLFWPMGIASAGAMRQAGTQATAFVGRRHFDDADLVARRFRLLNQAMPAAASRP